MLKSRGYTVRPSLGSALVGLVIFLAFVYLLFKVAAFALKALALLAPVLLIAAFFIHRETVLGYFRWIGQTFRTNIALALAVVLLSLLAYPLVCGYLFGKAMLVRKVGRAVEDFQARARDQAATFGGGGRLGSESGRDFTEVRREDGMVIRIPREGEA